MGRKRKKRTGGKTGQAGRKKWPVRTTPAQGLTLEQTREFERLCRTYPDLAWASIYEQPKAEEALAKARERREEASRWVRFGYQLREDTGQTSWGLAFVGRTREEIGNAPWTLEGAELDLARAEQRVAEAERDLWRVHARLENLGAGMRWSESHRRTKKRPSPARDIVTIAVLSMRVPPAVAGVHAIMQAVHAMANDRTTRRVGEHDVCGLGSDLGSGDVPERNSKGRYTAGSAGLLVDGRKRRAKASTIETHAKKISGTP